MNFQIYKSKFLAESRRNGCTEQFISDCLNYAKNLHNKQVPIVFNDKHLSFLLGYEEKYLKKAVTHTSKFYRNFSIAKKSGKPRGISEPLPNLKDIQSWILHNMLSKVGISKYAKAYIQGKGIKHNVRFHVKQKMLFTADISNFFPSLPLYEVEKVFLNFGYTEKLANLLAKLCCKSGSLPQGAPTSPYLSNLIMFDIDNKIGDFCAIRKIRYTRYADDMSFSGDFNLMELKSYLIGILSEKNLKLNTQKCRLMSRNTIQMVTGIVVNEKPQVAKVERHRLRQELYYIQKFGLVSHLSHRGINDHNYLKHLFGKVGYVNFINPKDQEFVTYKSILKELLRKEKILLEE